MNNQVLLSICIPTYNRAGYLSKCLSALLSQITPEINGLIEVCVSNNASTDHTNDIVNGFINKGYNIAYNINEKNLGADANVEYCFSAAIGKYAWIFGDDDFLQPGFLKKIIELLQNNNLGVLYLNGSWHRNENEIIAPNPDEFSFKIYEEPLQFFSAVNYWITFLTGNIVNKKSLITLDWRNQYHGTSLDQLRWVLPAIFMNTRNAVVETKVLACKADNTSGYNLVQVFSVNFNKILDYNISRNIIPAACKGIMNDALITIFYPNLLRPGFRKIYFNHLGKLFSVYGKDPRFYWSCVMKPVIKSVKQKLKLG